MRLKIGTAVALAVALGLAGPAFAVSSGGLTFTSLDADLVLVSATGIGTQADPIVLTETIYGLDVNMSIAGLPNLYPSPYDVYSGTGFWIQKVVTNLTGETWTSYDHELQQVFGTPSSDGDGLSFAQGLSGRPWTSDVFTNVEEIIHPRDYINFYGGSVPAGGTVTFKYVIHDFTPISPFYLRQRPNYRPGVIPEPLTMVGLFGGTVGLAGYVRKRRRS